MHNEYEASEGVEVGRAEEMILGEKEEPFADQPGLTPEFRLTIEFAKYDE